MKKTVKILIMIPAALAAAAALYFFVIAAPPKPAEKSYYSPGDSFVTNIKDSLRLVKATIMIEVLTNDAEKTKETLTAENQKIRDIIIFTIRGKTENELRADDVKETLCAELISNLKKGLEVDYITGIYFTDYVIQ